MRSLTAAGLLVALACLAPLAAAGVLVVDAAGGGDFTTLQDAVDASADGDVILVAPGNYTSTPSVLYNDLGAHSLTIARDGEGEVLLDTTIVRLLPAGHSIVLRGLTFTSSGLAGFFGGNLAVRECDGVVLVEDCRAEGFDGAPIYPGSNGLRAVNVYQSAAVLFQRCTFLGGNGSTAAPDGFPFPLNQAFSGSVGVAVDDSDVAFHDCVLAGGAGGDAVDLAAPGGSGAAALSIVDSVVTLSGTVLTGGAGGDGCTAEQTGEGCRGGDAVTLLATGEPLPKPVQVRHLDAELLGGAAGDLEDGAGTALPGTPIHAPPGTWQVPHSGQAVAFVEAGPLRTGELGTMTIEGPADALFGLFGSLELGYFPTLNFKGVLAPGAPLLGPLLLTTIPRSGQLVLDYPTPDIGAFGLDSLVVIGQLLVDQGDDGIVLSAPATHVQVGAGF